MNDVLKAPQSHQQRINLDDHGQVAQLCAKASTGLQGMGVSFASGTVESEVFMRAMGDALALALLALASIHRKQAMEDREVIAVPNFSLHGRS